MRWQETKHVMVKHLKGVIKEILRIRRIDLGGMVFIPPFFAIFHAIMKIRLKKQVKAYDFRRESKDYG